MSSFFTVLLTTATNSVTEPAGTGTRWDTPSSFPSNLGITNPMALAAPEEVGTIFKAAARALRKSPFACGPSRVIWSPV